MTAGLPDPRVEGNDRAQDFELLCTWTTAFFEFDFRDRISAAERHIRKVLAAEMLDGGLPAGNGAQRETLFEKASRCR